MKGGITMSSTFHERVTAVVKERKLNQTEFATRIGISQQYLSQICNGKKNPSDRTISDICREFRVNEKWLRTGEGAMEIEDTQRDKLNHFFADVLATAPDERSAFVAALDDLSDEFWPLVAELARKYADNLKNED
jgi:transcriptional regulator with XRE-family HTH domain